MITTHNLGFPIFTNKTSTKQQHHSLQAFRKQQLAENNKSECLSSLRQQHWQDQNSLDLVPVGDFSFCDPIQTMSYILGNATDSEKSQQTKQWFDTDTHYVVPQFNQDTKFTLDASCLLDEIETAKASGINLKPVIIGPVTYLWSGISSDGTDKLDYLQDLLSCYAELLKVLSDAGVEWVQIDEPILSLALNDDYKHALLQAYYSLQRSPVKTLLATYFGKLDENLNLLCELPVDGVHIDAISAEDEVLKVIDWLPSYKVVSVGVVNARQNWETDLNDTLQWLKPMHELLGDRLWLAPACSLAYLPSSSENTSVIEVALHKLAEVKLLATALDHGEATVTDALTENAEIIEQNQQQLNQNKAAA